MAGKARYSSVMLVVFTLLIALSGCNLSSSPEQQLALTEVPTNTPPATRTPLSTGGAPTPLPITQQVITLPTSQSLQIPSTSVSLPPTNASFPTSTQTPISIVILSPIPGNIVAGNVQVLGAAIHPQFLQYQVEYGPDPNPGNLWYPATGIVQTPVLNGLLGIWNTTAIQDSIYQLRLRLILRDGTSLATVVNNIRIQNQLPTPVPSPTPNIPRPIAAFTQDRSFGQAPLVVRFINQSSGNITSYAWTFGDGGNSGDANPIYTFRLPGIYNITLSVTGPGGTSNVTQQINVQSPTAPVAAFTQDKISGTSPLTIQFTNQSTGTITNYNWTFGDGTTSTDISPTHQFITVGTYNVILSVTGPGGTSFVTRKITVEDPVIPPPVAEFNSDKSSGNVPLSVQFVNNSTGQITSFLWEFGDGQTSTDRNPVHIFASAGAYTTRLTAIGPGGQSTKQASITAIQPPSAPVAKFATSTLSGTIPLTVNFTDQSTGAITAYSWAFGDGQTSTSQSPSHEFLVAGTYSVVLRITGPGGSDEEQVTINALPPIAAPIAAFTADQVSGVAPLTVQFTNQSTGESMNYEWNFDDGSPISSEVNPTHQFTTPGVYNVTLTAANSSGSNSSAPTVITVNAAAVPPLASFSSSATTITEGETITFTSTSSGTIDTYVWDIRDSANAQVGSGNTDTLPFTFTSAGSYSVALTVSGPAGSNSSAPTVITVNAAAVPPPINKPLVFVSNRTGNNEIYALAIDGILTNLTNTAANDESPVYSPDGGRIVFVSDRDQAGNNEIYVMNADGTNIVRLTDNSAAPADDANPVWSPDGARIYFVTNRDGNYEVYSMNADGSDPVNITNNPATDRDPSPSPDGSRIAFASDLNGSEFEIYTLAVSGARDVDPSSLVNLTNASSVDIGPSWSPDGGRITFVTTREGGSQIYIMNSDGSGAYRASDGVSSETEPSWSYNSDLIVFVSQRDGFSQLYVIRPDGSGLNRVSDLTASDTSPGWRP